MQKDKIQPNEVPSNILISSDSFYTLKKTLIENIGLKKTKSFLFRFGYDIGVSASIQKSKNKDMKSYRGEHSMHAMYGQVRQVILESDIEKLIDGTVTCIKGKWIDSFEAQMHLHYFGHSKECVCHTLCGYVNGFLWNMYRLPVITVETNCKAMGAEHCEFEIRHEDIWLHEDEDIIKIYRDSSLVNNLEDSYDELLTHKHFIDRLSNFHSTLTQSMTEKKTMKEIIENAYSFLNIPIIIEDLHGEQILHSGLDLEQLITVQKNKPKLKYVEMIKDTRKYKTKEYTKLESQVLINKKPYATCSFIYFSSNVVGGNDHLFLDRIANVIALGFLYEEVQYEEQDRLSHTILDRLLTGNYQSIDDIRAYFKLYPFKVKPPYNVISLSVTHNKTDTSVEMQEQLTQLSRYFNQFSIPSIFSLLGEQLVFINILEKDTQYVVQQFLTFINMMKKRNPHYEYKMGVSNDFEDLTAFPRALKEANIAKQFPNKHVITYYNELGLLGNFVVNLNVEQLHEIAQDMLGELYDFKDVRKKELLYTLYQYLLNGQKLKETMATLCLSMGGLQYRLRQIDIVLNNKLKDAAFTSYLLLVIESLIVTNELDFIDIE